MASYRATIDSPHPPDAVFAYLAAFEHTAEWDPGCSSARPLQLEAPEKGSAFALDFAAGPRTIALRYEILEFDPPRALVLRGDSRELWSVDTIEVGPGDGGGSRVTYAAEVGLHGPAKLLDPILSLGFRRVGDRARDGLRDRLAAPL